MFHMDTDSFHDQIRADIQCGLSTHAIAKKHQYGQSHIYRITKMLGIKSTAKSGPPRVVPTHENCAACGAVLSRYRKTYCNNTCQQNHRFNLFVERWLGDDTYNPVQANYRIAPASVRRALIFLRGNKCETCGWCEVNKNTGKVPIQIHHEDGDDRNNRPHNVKLLCPNCHSLTPTWGAKNKRKHPMPRIGMRDKI